MFMPKKSLPRKLKYSEALSEGLVQAMQKDEKVIVMGQSATEPFGLFGTLSEANKKYPSRMFEMPLSENGITGWGTGAALSGMKPVMTHHRNDFLLLAMDQIVNHAAKWMYMHRKSVNWTIRTVIGRGWGQGPQHSQNLYELFAYIPGLKVLVPATAYDAKGMLTAAIDDPSPTLIFEHRRLYESEGNVPKDFYKSSLDRANIIKEGNDLTIISISQMLMDVSLASEALSKAGIEAEIIDLRCIRPLDTNTLIKSVRKTGRVIICDTGNTLYGVGAEIAASIADEGFNYLNAPIKRIGLPDCPTPASYALEEFFYPGVEDILRAAASILPAKTSKRFKDYATTHEEMTKFIGIF